MDLTQRIEQVAGDGREFLKTTVGLEYKTAGITLDSAAFTGDTVVGGTAVYRQDNGLFGPATTPPVDGAGVALPLTGRGACLTAHAVKRKEGANPIVGAIAKCYADRTRCTGVTDAFVTAAAGRINFDL